MKMLIEITSIGAALVLGYFFVPWIYGKNARILLKRLTIRANAIVLTFDDGPSDVTLNVLRILREHKVKGTFFFSGRNIAGREHIVRQVAAEGHEIGSHGFSHLNYWKVSPFRAIADIKLCWAAINTSLYNEYVLCPFRPPYGKLSIVCLLYLFLRKIPIIYWTIDSHDISTFKEFDSQRNTLLLKKEGGAVILAHDHDPKTEDRVLSSLRATLVMAENTKMRVLTVAQLLATRSNKNKGVRKGFA